MRFVVFTCLGLLVAQTARSSTLLAESLEINCCGTFSSAVTVPRTVVGGQFHLGYDMPFEAVSYADGTYLQVVEDRLAQLVGGSLMLGEGDTGVFDFTTDTPAISVIAAKLTDGVDDPGFWIGSFGFNADRIVAGGGGFGGSESGQLGLEAGQDLAGNVIDFFRLTVDEVSWGPAPPPNELFWTTTIRGSWQVYGSPIPEPSTVLLVGLGLLALARRRRG